MTSIAEERKQIFTDLYNGIIPKRVPISIGMGTEVYVEKAGLPVGKTAWTHEGLEQAADDFVKDLRVDTFPGDSVRPISYSEISGSRMWKMGSNGFMQHPESVFIEPDDYDKIKAAPWDYVLETLIPTICEKMGDDPVTRALTLHTALAARGNDVGAFGMVAGKLSAKYGFFAVPPNQQAFCLHPLDFIASRGRGFTGISKDMRRYPEKVFEAAESFLPLFVINALPDVITPMGATTMTCHMPTFMRTKDFEKYYYPTMSKLIHATAEAGQAFSVFCEDNWDRYMDHLQDLPQGTRLQFEYGDPQLIKDKLGKKFIINGLYPSVLLKTGTKQQCIDKAKELLDVMAPGGNYIFNFDKSPTTLSSTNPENLKAVIDYVADNGAYSNAGEKTWTENREDTIHKVKHTIPKFESKYFTDAEKYLRSCSYPIKELEPTIAKIIEKQNIKTIKEILRMM
ncbi:uroporphyrinogen decarboxylase (URO-D) [Oxobacter pfennigii]|uniref:Uroporphyrinogen decarboxylase (URO-D) n=1 Tax=Oxobacter pfennigii TaxID=36849 RepID=A0A0P8W8K5_9CLOT|nr:uroporphyrinogen decarboxylase family protein [Oxobacter pfennigii]KPU44337.1 uroporphyrinogen decarboxylase (URO-D) [Oxobacter pfennigii]